MKLSLSMPWIRILVQRWGSVKSVDYLVLGAGPARLQRGYFLARSAGNYLILETGLTPGTFFRSEE